MKTAGNIVNETDPNGLQSAFEGLKPPAPLSRRWWLLPPVLISRRRRRNAKLHRQVLSRMTEQQLAGRSGLPQKATGWFIVAAGALLLAMKETRELAEASEWATGAFVGTVILMAILAAACAVPALLDTRPLGLPWNKVEPP